MTSQPPPLQSPLDLFAYELSMMHVFEQRNVRTLEQLLQETEPELARRPIEHHLEETREQVRRLGQCFHALGQPPQPVDVQTAQGLQQDHEQFRQLHPSPEVLAMHNVAAAAKIEHLEVAAYRGLLDKAILMGQTELAQHLKHILQQEERAAADLESAGWLLGRQAADQSQLAA